MKNKETICAVVVTFNRKNLLIECLEALMAQTRQLDNIYIIDNASNDGTSDYLNDNGYLNNDKIKYIKLSENLGGAGGFYEGVKRGCEHKFDWIWLMDDDANPKENALEKLMEINPVDTNIYGSVASYYHNGSLKLCFPSDVLDTSGKQQMIEFHDDLHNIQMVSSIPFLGFLVNSRLVKKIGFPDPNFFISADDVEYCLRARTNGCKIILVKNSIIFHPASTSYIVHFAGHKFYCLRLAPWRRYYDVRNRIIIARYYYGIELYTKTFPGLIIRLFASIFYEKETFAQIKFFLKGIIDGILEKTGKRVSPF